MKFLLYIVVLAVTAVTTKHINPASLPSVGKHRTKFEFDTQPKDSTFFNENFKNAITFTERIKNFQTKRITIDLFISSSINLFLGDGLAGMKHLESFFFASNPVFKYIDITVMTTTEPFNPESKFYQAESIQTGQEGPSFPDILRHFQGRQATLTCEKGELFDLIEFVNRWKSGEAFQKLEHLDFKKLSSAFLPSQDQFLNAIAAQYIDATKKPPSHTLPKVYDRYCSLISSKTYTIVSHTYVVRESDNRVASVLIEQETLRFGVWDKTEEEFLRMMD